MKIERQAFNPAPESLRRIEASLEHVGPDDPTLTTWHRAYAQGNSRRIALDLDIAASRLSRGDSVLECGSIPLLLTKALSDLGYHVVGCDIAPERFASAIAKNKLRVEKCDIETQDLPFDDETFDGVIFNELFEHLRINPIFTMSEVLRVLKPKGRLMLSTPNLRSLGGLRNFVFRDRAYSCSGNVFAEYKKLDALGHMGHVREYTVTEVTEFLQQIGFVVTACVFRGEYKNPVANRITALQPKLSPFVSYIAVKP